MVNVVEIDGRSNESKRKEKRQQHQQREAIDTRSESRQDRQGFSFWLTKEMGQTRIVIYFIFFSFLL